MWLPVPYLLYLRQSSQLTEVLPILEQAQPAGPAAAIFPNSQQLYNIIKY